MRGSLSTLSYTEKDAQDQLDAACAVNPLFLIVDTRLTPWCHWSPTWRRAELLQRYGSQHYTWKGDLLGNIHHGMGLPIQLADERAGLRWVQGTLESGRTVLLLCGCRSYKQCHRKVIYDQVCALLHPSPVLYQPGQRVQTPKGAGLVSPHIPLSISLQRNCYAVLLDGWDGPMQYLVPSELTLEKAR